MPAFAQPAAPAYSTHPMDLDEIIRLAIEEDVGTGDITTDSLSTMDRDGMGELKAKEACVVFGVDIVRRIFSRIDASLRVEILVPDGGRADKGTTIVRIGGRVASILKGERIALNFIQRLSGVATMTSRFAERLTHAHVYDTRKTTPLLRGLEKAAVKAGGGKNHRMGLYDAILIKDNHVTLAGSVAEVLQIVRKAHPDLPREIEVRGESELREALAEGAEILLLDNMTPDGVKACLTIIDEAAYEPEVEVSGNVHLDNVRDYDLPGVHRISVGALTHSPRNIDMNLKIV
jgi:nicotinate-nucleotide pyrophosphorylase (carboxylating)